MKLTIYKTARLLGLFRLARFLTRRRVRVLAYHAFAVDDETRFRSKLFINRETFQRRLDHLRDHGYRVVGIDTAARELANDDVRPGTVVITIDDGYASTLHIAAPLLRSVGFEALVYVTTYHMQTQTPVFDLLIGYLIWKTGRSQASLEWPAGAPPRVLDLSSSQARGATTAELLRLGHDLDGESARVELGQALARSLDLDLEQLPTGGSFRLMSWAEAREIEKMGVTIGLHTHRHRFPPDDLAACRRELEDNSAFLDRELGRRPRHFCYPSGVYSSAQFPVLEQAGVLTATTCDPGLARPGESPLAMRRFLDGESVSDIEFEAELSGFSDLLRQWVRGRGETSMAAGR